MKKKKVEVKKPATFLLRDIDRDFWAKVKAKASLEQVTIKVFIMDAIKDRMKRKAK